MVVQSVINNEELKQEFEAPETKLGNPVHSILIEINQKQRLISVYVNCKQIVNTHLSVTPGQVVADINDIRVVSIRISVTHSHIVTYIYIRYLSVTTNED